MGRVVFMLLALLFIFFPSLADATTITVNSPADDLDQAANGNCTLREALVAANTNAAVDGCPAGQAGPAVVDLVRLPAGTYNLSVGGRGEDAAQGGDLDIIDDVMIVGVGADQTFIDAGQIDRVFDVDPGEQGLTATLAGLAIRGGNATSGETGGGIRNRGTLTVEQVWISDNLADGPGGGIRNDAVVMVIASTLDGNTTNDHGGGMDNHGTATVESSTVRANTVVGGGAGGGLYNLGGQMMTVRSTTVTGNSAAGGDAILNNGDLTMTSTLVQGGCSGVVTTSQGGSLESPGDTCGLGSGDQINVTNPGLGAFANHGGTTPTYALQAGSPAIDAAASGLCLSTDQRGAPRPFDGDGNGSTICDVGAFEAGATVPTLLFADGFESGDTSQWLTTP